MIKIGQPAPNFSNIIAYQAGKEDFMRISLEDYRGKWLVFFFYPADFTFVCPTELREFAKHADDFSDEGAQILAASTDGEHAHAAWFGRDLPQVKYPILADRTQDVTRSYEVLETDGTAQRGTFIIDPDGVVRYIIVSDNSVGRSVKETLRVLMALKTGELCPIEWEKGDKTLS
ncbi:MAG: peroxiredoxin [Candidatus Saccharimonadia bacterium]